jgi:hypothetical protein
MQNSLFTQLKALTPTPAIFFSILTKTSYNLLNPTPEIFFQYQPQNTLQIKYLQLP